jgi:predicted TIM-barrel fold metal-dependent hydrolase
VFYLLVIFVKECPAMNKQPHGIIDLHVHIFPKRMFEAVWNYFETRGWPVHHEHVETIIDTLQSHGVDCAVGLSYPHKTGVAKPLNRFMEDVGRKYPFFKPFASVHPDDEDFQSYVDQAFESPHIFGFKFQPLVQGYDVNDPRLDYLYQGCLEREFPITMHIGTGPIGNEFVGPDHFRRLMERFPELRVCVPHMGGPEYDEFLSMMGDYPNMWLDTTMINTPFDLVDLSFQGYQNLLMKYADRICYGSDWPNVPYSYRDALGSVANFGFSEEDYEKVMRANGRRFLGIPG